MTVRTTHRATRPRAERGTASLESLLSAIVTAAVVIINSVGAPATASLGIISALVLML
ncbi:hypothetical protein [Nocardia suismassiliense]|uniref:hypothetical protein n=1 Tax=Nocardia suismassiliense TaxID=2077092 RepID=UPI00131ED7C7|nr:hypothetical protein [Nocardia suismassiliense]